MKKPTHPTHPTQSPASHPMTAEQAEGGAPEQPPYDWGGSESLGREFFWMLRHASWAWGKNRSGRIIDCGRTWYDGPIWFANIGPIGVSLYVR